MSTSNISQSKWGSRKFFTMAGSMFMFTILLTNGHIDQNTYLNLMYITVGGYLAANVTQHIKGK